MGRYQKLGKNVALITLGNFASKLLSFFMIPLYTAVLSTEEYGTVDLMVTTTSLLSPFFTLLMSEAVMRFALDEGKDKAQVFSVGVFTTLGGFVVMLVLSPIILLSDNIGPFYGYFLTYYLFSTVQNVVAQFVKGINKVGIFSLAGVLQILCAVVLNVLFLLVFKMGIEGYLLAIILSNFFAILLLWFGARLNKYLIQIKRIDKNLLKEMWKYALPMIPNSLSWWISNSSDKYMITLMVGVSATGIYSVSQRIPSMFVMVSTIFINAWQISAVEDFGSEDSRIFYSNIYKQYSSLLILIVSAMVCGTRILARILFSNDFYEGWIFVPILLLAYYFNAISSFLGTIYTSAKKTKLLFISTIVAAGTNIALNVIFIPWFGAMGAAFATFASYFVIWIIRWVNTRKILPLSINYKSDVSSYLLLMIQVLLIMQGTLISFAVACFAFGIICFINKDFIKVLQALMLKVLRIRKKENVK